MATPTNFILSVQIKYVGRMPGDSVLYHTVQFVPVWNWKNVALCCWCGNFSSVSDKSDTELFQLRWECSCKILWKYPKGSFEKFNMQTMITFSKLMFLYVKISVFLHLSSRQGKVRGGVARPVAGRERGCKNLLLKRREVLVQRDGDLQHSAAKTWKHTGWVRLTQKSSILQMLLVQRRKRLNENMFFPIYSFPFQYC